MRASFYDQLYFARYKSLVDALNNDPEFTYRRFCRIFSKNFHTPLEAVEKYPVGYVLTHVLEHQLDDKYEEDIFEFAKEFAKTPEDIKTEEAHLQDLIKRFEEEEKKKLENKNKKNQKPEQKQELPPEINMNFEDDENL